MTDRVHPGGRIDPEIKKEFKEYVQENSTGNKGDYSRLLERALVEYMDNDRGARIESKVDDVLDRLDEMESPPPPQSEDTLERERQSATSSNDPFDGYNTRTEETVAAIAADLEGSNSVNESMLETAIEDNAGASYKTLKKYKRLLKKRGMAIPHPNVDEDAFYVDRTALVLSCETGETVTPHDIDTLVGEYEDELGEEWYLESLPEDYIAHNELDYDRHPDLDSSGYRDENGLSIDSKTFQ